MSCHTESTECFLHGFVSGEGADVVAVAGHFVGIDRGLGGEPGDETAGGIGTTTAIDAFLDEMAGFAGVVVEGWDAPVALGGGWLLFHGEDQAVGIDLCDAGLMEAGVVGLVVAHDASGAFFFRKANERAEAEVQEIVAGHHQEVVIKRFTI